MFGRRMTFLLGADGNNFVLNTCKLREVSAEEAYRSLTVPVFGEGVVYDVPNHVLMEQKRFVKHGLSPENLRSYVPMIEKETRDYFKRWIDSAAQSGTDGLLKGTGELSTAIAELTILTASRCLMGYHIRKYLSETIAELYCDLDKGFTPLNFLFPWLPLETYRKRDEAHVKMRDLFLSIMGKRREKEARRQAGEVLDDSDEEDNSDMMRSLMDSEYRDGRKMTDREVACLMIALLMAGQHTSSTTGTWCLSYLANHPEIRKQLWEEQKVVLGDESGPLDYDSLKRMTLLDNCVREALRLKPPIITIMRKVMEPVEYGDYVIPEGDYISVSPALAQLDEKVWGPDASEFNPHRFTSCPHLTAALGHGACSSYLPFGAGRHRCIGEAFAFIQLKTVIATFIQIFADWEMNGMPKVDYTTLIVMPVKPVDVSFTVRQHDKSHQLPKEE